ncbi:MAG TPA: phosphoribosyltransferase family protein [Flavobacteriales bacterium]|nr:phosphoribosyltransferase family protein [Flavobacteriales bacterium]
MLFIDREDAAKRLLSWLEPYAKKPGIVLAIPRGGVAIGYHIAKKFGLPLELLFTKKIGHPLSSELAVGAVSLSDYIVDPQFEMPDTYIRQQVAKIRKNLEERNKKFLGENYSQSDLKNKTVIIADDGIATGNTVLAAIQLVRHASPARIVVAAPVSAEEAAFKIRQKADDFVCLNVASDFLGVGQFYRDFSEVSDAEVERLLNDLKQTNTI